MKKCKFDWEGMTWFLVVILLFASCQMDRNRRHDIEKLKIENKE